MPQAAAKILKAVLLLTLAASPVLIYESLATGKGLVLAAGLVTVQLIGIMSAILTVTSSKHKWLLVAAVAAVLTFIIWQRPSERNVLALSGLPHAFAYLGLLTIFGVSLIPPRESVITILARRVRGPMSEEVIAYTRAVNWAWCFFFLAQLLGSLLLWLYAPRSVWLFFINILDFPLIAVMFFAEYGYRIIRFHDQPRDKFSHIWQMFAPVKKAQAKER